MIKINEEEIWKDIKDFEGLYQISNYGRVKCLPKYIYSLGYPQLRKEKISKLQCNKYGYMQTTLYKNHKPKTFTIHRLVAETFLENPNNLPCVNHKDEDKTNNYIENLEWCTHKYNDNYGTRGKRISEKHLLKGVKKAIIQYDLQGNFIKEWNSLTIACKELHYNINYISLCCNNKRKSYNGYKWKFKEVKDAENQ